jgi:hypothetical protein
MAIAAVKSTVNGTTFMFLSFGLRLPLVFAGRGPTSVPL